jgi:hypothetical protein
MRPRSRNLTGKRFGKLEAVKRNGKDERGKLLWQCRCDCGNTRNFTTGRLCSLLTLHCGCEAKKRREEKSRLSKIRKSSVVIIVGQQATPSAPYIPTTPLNNFLYHYRVAP